MLVWSFAFLLTLWLGLGGIEEIESWGRFESVLVLRDVKTFANDFDRRKPGRATKYTTPLMTHVSKKQTLDHCKPGAPNTM